jgi:hypothetical protein
MEFAEVTFAAEGLAFFLFRLVFAFAGDAQHPVVQRDIDLFLFHARQFAFHEHVVFVLMHIERWRPAAE